MKVAHTREASSLPRPPAHVAIDLEAGPDAPRIHVQAPHGWIHCRVLLACVSTVFGMLLWLQSAW